MSSSARVVEEEHDLRELSDPEFFVHWAQVRMSYAVEHIATREDYEAMVAEYHRRLDGN